LIIGSPGKIALLNGCPAITGELLKEPSSFEEILGLYFGWSNMKPIGIPSGVHFHYTVAMVCPDASPPLHVEKKAHNVVEDRLDGDC